jgi:hypothetical protein
LEIVRDTRDSFNLASGLTRRSSRPLRAQDRWVFETLTVARSRQLNGNPFDGFNLTIHTV